jgi:hypothetical protein
MSEELQTASTKSQQSKKPSSWSFFSLKLSDVELKKQLEGYSTLKFWQTYRRS